MVYLKYNLSLSRSILPSVTDIEFIIPLKLIVSGIVDSLMIISLINLLVIPFTISLTIVDRFTSVFVTLNLYL